jgi:GNAT superfamily N-acetyltransferase
VRIRQLREGDDLSGAIELLCRFFKEEGFDTAPSVIATHAREMAKLETCGLFVAEYEGEPVAVASVSLEFGIEYGWWAEMGDLYVLPGHRGRGLSMKMVEAIEAFLRSREATGYQVTVTPYASDTHDLTKYYQRLGFESEGRLILRKRLD